MSERVVVTGMGAVSPLGPDVESLWSGLLAGRPGIRRVPRLAGLGLRVTTGGDVPGFQGEGRHLAMATRAIDAALDQAGLAAPATALLWATALDTYVDQAARPGYRSSGACFDALARRHRPPRRLVAVACASGTQSIGEALWLIREGRVSACVAGGSSAMLDAVYTTAFSGLGAIAVDREGEDPAEVCRPFDRVRRGFALSEGAGALVLESEASARARGARPLAEVVGLGTSQDAHDLNQPPPDGAGAVLAIRRGLEDAGLAPGDIDLVNAHGTGTFVGDSAEAAALRAVFPAWRERPLVHGMKGTLGHSMSAAGALEAIVAILSARQGVVPATLNLRDVDEACALCHVVGGPREAPVRRVLSTSFGMGGQNAALILQTTR
jgi:3-oxoacyl-[acyl-carrier-protein] synthase II